MAFDFAQAVLTWFDEHGRKDLPWQKNISKYSVWISEIMLQQTQVKTVIPFYERFMLSFPDVVALANAPQEDVLHHWTGLGYYARARNLHKAAQQIRDNHKGVFPSEFADVLALPGIGRSTASAILSIAQQQRLAILDGNVKRVLARFFAVEGWPGNKKVEDEMWLLAESLLPKERINDYTQVMMDLGATLCTRSRPACELCPVHTHCLAYAQGRQTELPHKKPKKEVPHKYVTVLIPYYAGRAWMKKRLGEGIWGGLWWFEDARCLQLEAEADRDKPDASEPLTNEFSPAPHPLSEAVSDLGQMTPEYRSSIMRWIAQWGAQSFKCHEIATFKHTFSHFHLHISPVIIELDTLKSVAENTSQARWVDISHPDALGYSAPAKIILQHMQDL